jgi:hypothetical protein
MPYPLNGRQLALLGFAVLSGASFVYELNSGNGLYLAVFSLLFNFALLSGLLFGSLALWDLLKRVVKRFKRPTESKEPAESTKGRR